MQGNVLHKLQLWLLKCIHPLRFHSCHKRQSGCSLQFIIFSVLHQSIIQTHAPLEAGKMINCSEK